MWPAGIRLTGGYRGFNWGVGHDGVPFRDRP